MKDLKDIDLKLIDLLSKTIYEREKHLKCKKVYKLVKCTISLIKLNKKEFKHFLILNQI